MSCMRPEVTARDGAGSKILYDSALPGAYRGAAVQRLELYISILTFKNSYFKAG